jgi:hypothetical protein
LPAGCVADAMSRTSYHTAYYRDTAPRRRYLACFRRALRLNCVWLLEEIRNHRESEPSVNVTPRLQPLRRPVLSLKQPLRTNSKYWQLTTR